MKKNHSILVFVIMFLNLNFTFAQPDNRFRQPHSKNQFEVLLYTSPNHWHNLTEPVAILEFQDMANRHAFGLTYVTLTNRFTDANLAKFDVIVFLQATSKEFAPEELESIKKFIRNGGGFVGIHATSACKNEDEWFRKLVGRTLTDHPEEQTAVMHVIDKNHPATMNVPDRWVWTDEWYSYSEALTPNQKVLITLDEKTYDPNRCWGNPNRKTGMGIFHPIAWYQEYDGGRSFFTTMGHLPSDFKDPWFLNHIYGGIYWAATGLGVYEK
jgi:type 1 glutamine amidotransferase